jgi:hypothetical protein
LTFQRSPSGMMVEVGHLGGVPGAEERKPSD